MPRPSVRWLCRPNVRRPIVGLVARIAGILLSVAVTTPVMADDAGDRLEAFTGGHSVQDQGDAQDDTLARGRKLRLMGLDSRDGLGERPLRTAIQNYAKPLLTPDGSAVVYSDHFAGKVFVVDWRSGESRELCAGFALDVWADPVAGTTWVYHATRTKPLENYIYKQVRRTRIDVPSKSEPVWDATQIGPDNFQLSADGLRAAGEFPWPDAGVADLTRGKWKKRATGCWASLAPDNSGLCAVFDGPHRNWQLRGNDPNRQWIVNLNAAPGMDGHEVFHPRWSNHVRYLTVTGPYAVKGALNFISGGGPKVEVLIGRLSPEFDKVERWLQATSNTRGDFHPDLWIAGGEQSSVPTAIAGEPSSQQATESTGDLSHTVFVWRDARSQNQVGGKGDVPESCQVEPKGAALFDRHFAMHLRGGMFVASGAAPAGLNRCDSTGQYALSFVVTPESIGKQGIGAVLAIVDPKGPVGDLGGARPHAVTISYQAGELRIWFQGDLVRRERTELASPGRWNGAELRFGSEKLTGDGWRGRIERVRLEDRSADKSVLAADYQRLTADLSQRRPLSQWKVRGTVRQSTPIPTMEAIAPYRRALILHDVDITEVLRGELPTKRILVARWGLLDGRPVKGADPETGETLELTLESLGGHPELESERQLMETEDVDLPAFLDVGQVLE
ncbi:MAG: hypothetical protein NT069_13630 [Planctomycetota bacterium]|nr:hypothetical protein [Planctomycetota bacterium]